MEGGEVFVLLERSITNVYRLKRGDVRWGFWNALQCLHYAALHSEQNSFQTACGDLIKKWLLWLLSETLHLLFFLFSRSVDGNTWAQVIALYPTLVECITCSSSEVSSALKEALGPFKDFMQPPVSRVQNGESWPGGFQSSLFFTMKKSWMCLLEPRALKAHEHELSRWHEATLKKKRIEAFSDRGDDDPDLHTLHRMLLMWADNAFAFHAHPDRLCPPQRLK